MSFVIETDIGHDPDDIVALLWILAQGIEVDYVFVSPGHPQQIQLTHAILQHTSPKTRIVAATHSEKVFDQSNITEAVMRKYSAQRCLPDYYADDVPDLIAGEIDALVIGPPKGLSQMKDFTFGKVTMQGGFCPYSLYRPSVILEKFESQESVQSFNPGGCIKGWQALNELPAKCRQFVTKSLAHTMEASMDLLGFLPTGSTAAHMLAFTMSTILKYHPGKKFHDPLAAIAHFKPEIGTWIPATSEYAGKGKWTSKLTDNGDQTLVDVDRNMFWQTLSK